MRILFLTPFLPHRDAGHGTATVASRVVDHLSERHQLSVLTFFRGGRENDLLRDLEGRCARVRALPFPGSRFWRRQWIRSKAAAGSTPFLVSLFDAEPMRRAMKELLRTESFDLVHIDTTQMGPYVDLLKGCGAKKILLEIDVSMKPLERRYRQERSRWKRLVLRREWQRMRRYEPALCRKFDRVYVVSDEDRKLLTSEGCGNEPALFRYGVDSDLFDIPPKRGTGFEILFFGSFMHPPNVDAARWLVKSILPAIRAQVPDARLTLAGGEAAAVEGLGREPGVTVRGWVEDLKSCLRAADVCVVPLRLGGGVKLKTLEMMASGKPVVTTRVGCEGIHAEPGVHVLLGSTAEELASHIVALLRNEDLRQFLGDNARRLMMREHRWSENLAELERDYERLVHGAGAGVSAEALGQRSAPLLPVDRLKPARRVGTA